jgi:hypothetical protein
MTFARMRDIVKEKPPLEPTLIPSTLPPWQFGLKHLFILTTLAAFAAAVAATFGPKTLVASTGVILAWCNLSGAFRYFQQGRPQAALLAIAWITFLISLALPCINVFGPVFGWAAAWFTLTAPLNAIRNNAIIQPAMPIFLAIDAANTLALGLPLLIWRIRNGGGQRMSAALCLTMVGAWVMWDSPMLVGYYVWCLSFFLALAAIPVNRWLFAGMTALSALAIWAAATS